MINNFYSGTSGLQTPVKKRDFPAEFADKSRLSFYASLFNSIEINSSFYRIPQATTLSKWSNEVTDPFRFTFKLWQQITHQKGLIFDAEDVKKFMAVINAVGHKKGCLLIQLPPGTNISALIPLQNLLSTVRHIDPDGDWKVAVEFRNRSWYEESVYALLAEYNAGLVIQDLPASATPLNLSSDFIYLRFHGPNGGYRGSYTDSFLYEYATYINEWLSDDKLVYTYFNNTMGDALKNLTKLNDYVLSN